jgi:glycosyltransferase involved in cell wall biosynthesis
VRVLFSGDGPDRAALEQQARDLGLADRVTFTGHLQDVRPVYRDIDVHALTSYTEGFPNVVLESLCMGVPVLANDVGGTREIVEDGVTGILLPAGQPERIAAGLLRLIGEPAWARQLAANGHAVVMRDFSFKQRVLKEEALCRDVLAEWHR